MRIHIGSYFRMELRFDFLKNNDAVRELHRGVTVSGSLANATSTASVNSMRISSKDVNGIFSDEPDAAEADQVKPNFLAEAPAEQTQINTPITIKQAKDRVQLAFVLSTIAEWWDGEYKNGDAWLRGEGVENVAGVIGSKYALQEAYLNWIQGIGEGNFCTVDVRKAYLFRDMGWKNGSEEHGIL